jgi:hypothetical protein
MQYITLLITLASAAPGIGHTAAAVAPTKPDYVAPVAVAPLATTSCTKSTTAAPVAITAVAPLATTSCTKSTTAAPVAITAVAPLATTSCTKSTTAAPVASTKAADPVPAADAIVPATPTAVAPIFAAPFATIDSYLPAPYDATTAAPALATNDIYSSAEGKTASFVAIILAALAL